jgi:hypothetical protein
MLRDGILRSERVDQLSESAELFYRRLMSVVDDFGRYYASPKLLRADCYPLKEDKAGLAVEAWLQECQAAELVRVYAVEGKQYVQLEDFGQRNRSASKFPEPPDDPRKRKILLPLLDQAEKSAQIIHENIPYAGHLPVTCPSHDGGARADAREARSCDGEMRTSASAPPSDVSTSRANGRSPRPLRALASGAEGEGVVGGEGGGEARTREESPPPLSERDQGEMAKLLQMAMSRGTPSPIDDLDLLRKVQVAMQGASMAELAAALIRFRRSRKPPDCYGFWSMYLTDALSPAARAKLPPPIDPEPEAEVDEVPKCPQCFGYGVIGGESGSEVCTGGQIRASLANGAELCLCPQGEGWQAYLAMDDDVDGLPIIRREAVAV